MMVNNSFSKSLLRMILLVIILSIVSGVLISGLDINKAKARSMDVSTDYQAELNGLKLMKDESITQAEISEIQRNEELLNLIHQQNLLLVSKNNDLEIEKQRRLQELELSAYDRRMKVVDNIIMAGGIIAILLVSTIGVTFIVLTWRNKANQQNLQELENENTKLQRLVELKNARIKELESRKITYTRVDVSELLEAVGNDNQLLDRS